MSRRLLLYIEGYQCPVLNHNLIAVFLIPLHLWAEDFYYTLKVTSVLFWTTILLLFSALSLLSLLIRFSQSRWLQQHFGSDRFNNDSHM